MLFEEKFKFVSKGNAGSSRISLHKDSEYGQALLRLSKGPLLKVQEPWGGFHYSSHYKQRGW